MASSLFFARRNALSGAEMSHLKGHRSNVFACAWSPDSQEVVSASRDHLLGVWVASSGKVTITYSIYRDSTDVRARAQEFLPSFAIR